MKHAKQTVLTMIAKAGMKSAVKSAGAASTYCFHQPAEPKALRAMRRK